MLDARFWMFDTRWGIWSRETHAMWWVEYILNAIVVETVKRGGAEERGGRQREYPIHHRRTLTRILNPSFALRATEGRQIQMRLRTLLTGVTKIQNRREKAQKKDLPPSRLRSESKKKGVFNFPAEKVECPLCFY